MKKLAVFVEGQTEQIFMRKLLWEIAGANNISIRLSKISGGNKIPVFETITAEYNHSDAKYRILIYDCSGDSKVVSSILERVDSLKRQGYTKILGIRDYYPAKTPLPILQKRLKNLVASAKLPIAIILTVMEIEAWFLAETSHFEKINSRLTLNRIKSALGIDLTTIDVTTIKEPAKTLKEIYLLEGTTYDKSKRKVERTINSLDFEELYLRIRYEIKELNELINHLDDFMDV